MNHKEAFHVNGYFMLIVELVILGIGVLLLANQNFVGVVFLVIFFLLLSGFSVVQPNQAKVLILFGQYRGNLLKPGFWYTIPFSSRYNVSLRVRNFNSEKLKVNDVEGNPIEIAAVVVFKVVDASKAILDVENYENFVEIQSETALRHIASKFAYDSHENENSISLRSNPDEIADELKKELQDKLSIAGVEVLEARLMHLAYSPEIAQVMLQRQQAKAILAARKQIVEGAVGMVKDAIEKFAEDGSIVLDEERKAAMANNLLVAIVSEKGSQPIINNGSIY